MINSEERCFVEHFEALFPAQEIMRVRQYLEQVWDTISPDTLTDREKKIYRLGAAPDEIRFDRTWYKLWRFASPSKIARFGPFSMLTYPLQIRHIVQTGQLVPWHQDIGYQALRGKNAQNHLITCFVPIEPLPSRVASLEFALGQFPALEHSELGYHGAALNFKAQPVTTHFELDCGDAVVFGDHTPHRTFVPENPSRRDRWSFEYRLVRPEDCQPGRDYFNINIGQFIKT